MKLVRQTKLHFQEGTSDKVYEVDLCEIGGQFVVNFRYGRSGTALKEGTKTTKPTNRVEADKIFDKLVSEKTNKGYSVSGEAKPAETSSKSQKTFDKNARKEHILNRLREESSAKSFGAKIVASVAKVAGINKKQSNIERVIWRAGELKIKEAAPLIVKFIGTKDALRDYCCAWSLGFCGDETTIPTLSNLYNQPETPDFVRRITGEAMLKLSDATAQKHHQEKFIEQLPIELQTLAKHGTSKTFTKKLHEFLEKPRRGSHIVLEHLYQIDNETVRPSLLEILRDCPLKVNYFKPLRHIFKIAEYRRDAEVFGIIAKRFEIENQMFSISSWSGKDWVRGEYRDGKYTQTTKSELANDESKLAYSNRTREYLRRRCWRTLRRMGEIGDADFVKMAVGALLPFSDADAQEPKTSVFYNYRDENGNWDWRNPRKTTVSWDKFAPYLLFNHLLYENSPRYELKTGTRAFRTRKSYKIGNPAPDFREEAFPQLWTAQPVGLLHLLAESACLPVHEFAVRALRDCAEFVASLDVEAVLMLLARPYEITARFGFELAKARYDAANPNVELVAAVALCADAEARAEAMKWIDAKRDFFAKDSSLMLKLLISQYEDIRVYAGNLLLTTNYSEAEAQFLIGRLIAEMLAFDETKRGEAKSLSEILLKSFAKQLRKLNLNIIRDLLSHPLVEVQEFGGQILLNHETTAENLPNELINSLIESPFAAIRAIGIRLFGQLPDENLKNRESLIFALLSHELADVHASTRPILQRLSRNYADFAAKITRSIVVALLQAEKHEGVHSRLLHSIKQDIPPATDYIDDETARILVKSNFPQANELGGLTIQANAENWHENFATNEIIDFSNGESIAVREAAWKLAENAVKRFRSPSNENYRNEVSSLVRALDSKWEDSRRFWFGFFAENLTQTELTPEILVAICDSVRKDVEKFGRDLILRYFETKDGADYMLKLSEHPSPNMQLFVTNYLENYASGEPEKLEKLAPYFIRVLSLVNRARNAKTRVLEFIEREAVKSEKAAQIIAEILAEYSATAAIGDKAKTIESMLKIRRMFPAIALPIEVKSVEVRVKNAV